MAARDAMRQMLEQLMGPSTAGGGNWRAAERGAMRRRLSALLWCCGADTCTASGRLCPCAPSLLRPHTPWGIDRTLYVCSSGRYAGMDTCTHEPPPDRSRLPPHLRPCATTSSSACVLLPGGLAACSRCTLLTQTPALHRPRTHPNIPALPLRISSLAHARTFQHRSPPLSFSNPPPSGHGFYGRVPVPPLSLRTVPA